MVLLPYAGDDAVDDSNADAGGQQSAAGTSAAAASSPKVSGSPRGAGDNPLAAFLGSYRWAYCLSVLGQHAAHVACLDLSHLWPVCLQGV